MSTPWDELEGAMLSLARSGAIKDRLAEAYRNHLARLDTNQLPKTLRADFGICRDLLTRIAPATPSEDAVRATVRKMSSLEAEEMACRLVRLFAAAMREAISAVPETTSSGSTAAAVRVQPLEAVPQVTRSRSAA
jgi:hypothetical protein